MYAAKVSGLRYGILISHILNTFERISKKPKVKNEAEDDDKLKIIYNVYYTSHTSTFTQLPICCVHIKISLKIHSYVDVYINP